MFGGISIRWREISPNARRYMLYHVFATPGLICWYLLPFYLMMAGFSVFEAGWLFTIINLLSIEGVPKIGVRMTKI